MQPVRTGFIHRQSRTDLLCDVIERLSEDEREVFRAEEEARRAQDEIAYGGGSDDEEATSGEGRKRKRYREPHMPQKLGTLYLANCGNTRAFLVRANKTHLLTRLHEPSNEKERLRIAKHGL